MLRKIIGSPRMLLLTYYCSFALLGLWLWWLAEPEMMPSSAKPAASKAPSDELAVFTNLSGVFRGQDRSVRFQSDSARYLRQDIFTLGTVSMDITGDSWRLRARSGEMLIDSSDRVSMNGNVRIEASNELPAAKDKDADAALSGFALRAPALDFDWRNDALLLDQGCSLLLDDRLEMSADRCEAMLDSGEVNLTGDVNSRL